MTVTVPPAAALTCAPGDIVVVIVKANPSTVPSGSEATVVFKGLNCTDTTQTVTEVGKRFAPDPCSDGRSSGSITFTPHELKKNTLNFVPPCSGDWRFVEALFQGSTRLSKSWAAFTAL
jgi:hypothetical protein